MKGIIGHYTYGVHFDDDHQIIKGYTIEVSGISDRHTTITIYREAGRYDMIIVAQRLRTEREVMKIAESFIKTMCAIDEGVCL